VALLRGAGVPAVRGFALNDTHFDSVAAELRYGARISTALTAAGAPGKHFVVSTAENGSPWA
jgi:endoglucanase